MAPVKTSKVVGKDSKTVRMVKPLKKNEKNSKKKKLRTKKMREGAGFFDNLQQKATAFMTKATTAFKDSGTLLKNSMVTLLKDGISMKQVLTRVLNPANPDRILYKNSFFLKFLEHGIVENVVYFNHAEYDAKTEKWTAGVKIVEQNDTYYIYKKDYLPETDAEKMNTVVVVSEVDSASSPVATSDSSVTKTGESSVTTISDSSEATISDSSSASATPSQAETNEKIDSWDDKIEMLKSRSLTFVKDTLNRLPFAKLNDIPIIDRELVAANVEFRPNRNGFDYLLFEEKYDCLFKFLHVYKYQVSRLFWTSSEMIMFKKMGHLLDKMYLKLYQSNVSATFKKRVLSNLSLFPKGFDYISHALMNVLRNKKRKSTTSLAGQEESSISLEDKGTSPSGPLGPLGPEGPVRQGESMNSSTETDTSIKTVQPTQTYDQPFPLTKLNHGRIVSKLLKCYDIDSPVPNIVSMKFLLVSKKHPPFLLREAIFACRVAHAFLKQSNNPDENFDILKEENISFLSQYGKKVVIGSEFDTVDKVKLATKIHDKFERVLNDCKSILEIPTSPDTTVNNKLSHAIGELYSLKEAIQGQQGGKRKDKNKRTKKVSKVAGGGLMNYLQNKFSKMSSQQPAQQPSQQSAQQPSISSSILDSTRKVIKSASKMMGVDSVSIGFYKALDVIFHLTYKHMVGRLLENIFKSIDENVIVHFFLKLHERNLILHSVFMNTILFYLVNIHRGFTITSVVDRFVSLLLVSLSSVPTVHFIVSLRLAYNDIYYSTLKFTENEIENIPIFKQSLYIPVAPQTSSPEVSQAQPQVQEQPPQSPSSVSLQTGQPEQQNLFIESKDNPSPAPLFIFQKGFNDIEKNKFYAFSDNIGYMKILQLIEYKYDENDQVLITFKDGEEERIYSFKTPFSLQRMYKYEKHEQDDILQDLIGKINVLGSLPTYGVTKDLVTLLIGKYLLINDQYAGFVKKVVMVKTMIGAVTSSFYDIKNLEFKAIELFLTSDGNKSYTISIDLKDLLSTEDETPTNEKTSTNETKFLSTNSKTIKLVKAVYDE